MEENNVEEIIRRRAEGRLTKKQGIEFLKEYREHPERFLPLVDHQYRQFDEWQDEDSRNMFWDAGIFQDNCPYFAECWKIFTTMVMTVFISAKGIPWVPNLKNILVEFIRNGLIDSLSIKELPHIETKGFTDSSGNEFFSINMVLFTEDREGFIHWGRESFSFNELNQYNERENREAEGNEK